MRRNPWSKIYYHLYLLQLENYHWRRYWRLILQRGFGLPAAPPRHQLAWTPKLIILTALMLAMYTAVAFYMLFWLVNLTLARPAAGVLLWLAAIIMINYLLPALLLTLAVWLLLPADALLKWQLVARARRRLGQFPNLKIIGIAGSYGKTTVKEFIAAVLKKKFKVLVTPENINTPLGIARLILAQLNLETEILIVEMGEYRRGDVKDICRLTPPDIAVVTGINEAHLERFKTMANTIATIFEIAEFAKPGARVILNADDDMVAGQYKKYVEDHAVTWYSHKNALPELKINLLGRYALGSADAAVQVGRLLGVGEKAMRQGIASVEPIPHRLQPIQGAGGALIIDDSYNGNPAGVREAINVLARYADRRKIFITPGLVEMGVSREVVHEELGRELAPVADLVILIKNSATPALARGLQAGGFPAEKIRWFDSAPAAHTALKDIVQANDVVLFQNDWGDNYV